ncbi:MULTISPECIES: phage antirepressor [unclassified Streptomyces]|jgi:anti-repressor protein|uniref:phage antirepressor n=1 Tax=unclassified Streptomyces TaxID=2593676 RepID=UPI00259D7853|nr:MULTISPECIES: phage antirepressor [unclassified Streptomyces]MDM7320476.1 phage antirepressor [Fervidobacterium sp.]MDT9693763.1 phage antirepressor [Streptomyces sp. P9(2023)]MDT9700915.1 phage antirepressor [Streptomyces sp. P17]
MNKPQIFNFEQNEVRTILVNDEPYFVGKDVAEVLGYQNGSRDVNRHVDEEDMLTHQISASGQNRNMTIINESGLYSLILKSKLPSAKKFKRWVTSDVLPTIRKHGMYAKEELLDNPDLLIEVASRLKEERTKRLIAEQQVKELQPKADYYDTILANPSLLPISVIAKNYGMSANKMNQLLHELGVQYKQGNVWLLYADYQNEGYTHTEMKLWEGSSQMKPNTKWTQKGHIFIYQFLKKHDVYPTIETLFEKEA